MWSMEAEGRLFGVGGRSPPTDFASGLGAAAPQPILATLPYSAYLACLVDATSGGTSASTFPEYGMFKCNAATRHKGFKSAPQLHLVAQAE